eukprot:TRINITY_DN4425_c0_g1_i1.p1 TRINITY_DN4425_c0_g1~~TRINITY_DN4425_c0_g1_i1.p1  ORF type:complete len:949 (+),score=209.88 TRINITY_DN4425_c0_g1_i1:126-2972(+)
MEPAAMQARRNSGQPPPPVHQGARFIPHNPQAAAELMQVLQNRRAKTEGYLPGEPSPPAVSMGPRTSSVSLPGPGVLRHGFTTPFPMSQPLGQAASAPQSPQQQPVQYARGRVHSAGSMTGVFTTPVRARSPPHPSSGPSFLAGGSGGGGASVSCTAGGGGGSISVCGAGGGGGGGGGSVNVAAPCGGGGSVSVLASGVVCVPPMPGSNSGAGPPGRSTLQPRVKRNSLGTVSQTSFAQAQGWATFAERDRLNREHERVKKENEELRLQNAALEQRLNEMSLVELDKRISDLDKVKNYYPDFIRESNEQSKRVAANNEMLLERLERLEMDYRTCKENEQKLQQDCMALKAAQKAQAQAVGQSGRHSGDMHFSSTHSRSGSHETLAPGDLHTQRRTSEAEVAGATASRAGAPGGPPPPQRQKSLTAQPEPGPEPEGAVAESAENALQIRDSETKVPLPCAPEFVKEEPAPAVKASVLSGDAEARLRAVMTTANASPDELAEAIEGVETVLRSVQALVDEASRELQAKRFRETRAACEALHEALQNAFREGGEARLKEVIESAKRTDVPDSDIQAAEEKLAALQAETEEQRTAKRLKALAAERKGQAFAFAKQDNVAELEALLDRIGAEGLDWRAWRNNAGQTLIQYAKAMGCEQARTCLTALEEAAAAAAAPPLAPRGSHASSAVSSCASPAPTSSAPRAASAASSSSGATAAAQRASGVLAPPESSAHRSSMGSEAISAASPLPSVEVEAHYAPGSSSTAVVVEEAATATAPARREQEQPSAPPAAIAAGEPEESAGAAAEEEAEDEQGLPPLSPEEREALKKQAFRAVVGDNVTALEEVFRKAALKEWSSWKNRAEKDLLTLAEERGSKEAYSVLAKALGLVKEQERQPFEEGEYVWIVRSDWVQSKQATVMEDTPAENDLVLVHFWEGNDEPVHVERCVVHKSLGY